MYYERILLHHLESLCGSKVTSQDIPRPISPHLPPPPTKHSTSHHPSVSTSYLTSANHRKDTVPATFWACLQVCNISKLRQIVNDAKTGVLHDYLDTLQDCCRTIPLHWIKRPYGWNLTSGWKSNPSWSAPASPNEHALSPSNIALERDRKRCFMIEMPSVVTPIYPQSMIPWLRC